jgi:hypothetical protein
MRWVSLDRINPDGIKLPQQSNCSIEYTVFGGWVNRGEAVNALFFDFLRVRATLISRARPAPCSIFSIEGAVLDGFGDVFGGEGFHAVQIGDGAGDFEDAVVRPRAQPHLVYGQRHDLP